MDFLKMLQGCDHTKQRLIVKNIPQSEHKLGMPGIGPILTVKGPSGQVRYNCPSCQTDLPIAQNPRWAEMYRTWRPPVSTPPPAPYSASSKRGSSTQREPIGAKLRYDILTRDKYRCVKCGASQADGAKLHVDHKKPVSQGGTNHPSNLQTLCQSCNLGKGARRG